MAQASVILYYEYYRSVTVLSFFGFFYSFPPDCPYTIKNYERLFQLLTDLCINTVDADVFNIMFGVGAVGLETPAIRLDGSDAVRSSIGSDPCGIGPAEYQDKGPGQCGGDVAGAGVVADNKPGAFKKGNQFFNGSCAGEIGYGDVGKASYHIDIALFGSGAGCNYGEVEPRRNFIRQDSEPLDRPAFIAVSRGRDNDGVFMRLDTMGFQHRINRIDSIGFSRQDKPRLNIWGNADGLRDFQIIIDEVDAVGILLNLMRVEEMGELSCARHTGASSAAGQPAERSRPEKALQVDDGIEPAAAEAEDKQQQRNHRAGMVPSLAEKLAVKKDCLIQIGVIIDKRRELGADEPANLRIGKASAQGREDGQGHNYIAEGAGLDYKDVLRYRTAAFGFGFTYEMPENAASLRRFDAGKGGIGRESPKVIRSVNGGYGQKRGGKLPKGAEPAAFAAQEIRPYTIDIGKLDFAIASEVFGNDKIGSFGVPAPQAVFMKHRQDGGELISDLFFQFERLYTFALQLLGQKIIDVQTAFGIFGNVYAFFNEQLSSFLQSSKRGDYRNVKT